MNNAHAELLWRARLDGTLLDTRDFPTSIDAAYQLQAEVTRASGCLVCGFKIGATVESLMSKLGLSEPFFGPLFPRFCGTNGSSLSIATAQSPLLETEFVISIGQPVSSDGNTTIDDIRAATAWVSGGFEVIGTRTQHDSEPSGLGKIADSAANVALVSGDQCLEWQTLNFNHLEAELFINDQSIAKGHSGMSVAGNPFGMAAWLANHPRMRQRGLLPGDLIACGTCTGAVPIQPGDVLRAEFERLGTLSATVESKE